MFVGLMASGKSTIGELVARRVGRPLRDNDDTLRHLTGKTARELADEQGMDALHELERHALTTAVEDDELAIVTAAASTIDTPAGRTLLAAMPEVVWLDAPVDVLAERVRRGDHRPVGEDPAATLRRTAGARDAAYRAVATIVADATADGELLADQLVACLV